MRQCQYEFTQATDQRGRVAAKVRHGLVHLTLDVPHHDQLLGWASTVHKPLPGHVIFFEADQRTARETLSFKAGQCVHYQEAFVAGDSQAGSYVCQLTIASTALALAAGGAGGDFVAPAAREYAGPKQHMPEARLPSAEAAPIAIIGGGASLLSNTKQQLARLAALRRASKTHALSSVEETEAVELLATALGIHVGELKQLTNKPKHSPIPLKWHSKGGKIEILPTGYWRYTDWEGNTVSYEPDEPNFDAYARQQVDIDAMQGDCASDFVKANANAPLGPKEDANTWHHKNNLRTMQEVPRIIHDRFTHYGARSILRKRKTVLPTQVATVNTTPIIRKRKR